MRWRSASGSDERMAIRRTPAPAVIPAKAGIHFAFRRNASPKRKWIPSIAEKRQCRHFAATTRSRA